MMTILLEELISLNTGTEIGKSIDSLDLIGNSLLNNYRDHFLINMAELGTSPDTLYEMEPFELPKVTLVSNGEKKDYKLKMSIGSAVNSIMNQIEGDHRLLTSNTTLRNTLGAFGTETKRQLKNRKIDGILARKYPKLCKQAMHMGFDFNQDIPTNELSKSEMKVKQYLYQQLKRKEARRGQYEEDISVVDFE